jgi:hypothetical protein
MALLLDQTLYSQTMEWLMNNEFWKDRWKWPWRNLRYYPVFYLQGLMKATSYLLGKACIAVCDIY